MTGLRLVGGEQPPGDGQDLRPVPYTVICGCGRSTFGFRGVERTCEHEDVTYAEVLDYYARAAQERNPR